MKNKQTGMDRINVLTQNAKMELNQIKSVDPKDIKASSLKKILKGIANIIDDKILQYIKRSFEKEMEKNTVFPVSVPSGEYVDIKEPGEKDSGGKDCGGKGKIPSGGKDCGGKVKILCGGKVKIPSHLHFENGLAQTSAKTPTTLNVGDLKEAVNQLYLQELFYRQMHDSFDRRIAAAIGIPSNQLGNQARQIDVDAAAASMRKVMEGMATS